MVLYRWGGPPCLMLGRIFSPVANRPLSRLRGRPGGGWASTALPTPGFRCAVLHFCQTGNLPYPATITLPHVRDCSLNPASPSNRCREAALGTAAPSSTRRQPLSATTSHRSLLRFPTGARSPRGTDGRAQQPPSCLQGQPASSGPSRFASVLVGSGAVLAQPPPGLPRTREFSTGRADPFPRNWSGLQGNSCGSDRVSP